MRIESTSESGSIESSIQIAEETVNRYVGSSINSAFCVNLDRFIEDSGIEHWIYGHTHYNGGNSSMVGNTILHSNQLGYVKHVEKDMFNQEAVIVLNNAIKNP